MEKWYSIVRTLQDESEDKHATLKFADRVFHDLKNSRIREKQKFKNRMGPEFDQWILRLSDEFAEEMIQEIVNDDEFWELTLLITQRI
jgi:hypothetical protein